MREPCVLALGFFDGVHIGHGALLRRAREAADRLGCTAEAVSFDCHPATVVSGRTVPLLTAPRQRESLMRQLYGIDALHILHFDRQMMAMPWESFLADCLVDRLHAVYVVCGDDYRFGARGEGTAEQLKAWYEAHGYGCDVIPRVRMDGEIISSTRIRNLLLRGDAAEAERLLGHPHEISGEVLYGFQKGRTIGVPTANIAFPPERLVPAYGVYAATATAEGADYNAVVNIGVHPSVGALPAPVLEAHLLNFDKNIYGKPLTVRLHRMLRREQTFPSLDALRAQIRVDQEMAKRALAE